MARIVRLPDKKFPASELRADGSAFGGWWHESDDQQRIVCDLCPRACSLKPGDRGFCFVRENVGGEMMLTTYGRSTGFCVDPIEKKPLNHFFPGTAVLSFGTAGCNLGCKFCQNWDTSKSREVNRASERAAPETIAEAAVQLNCDSVAFTYNDPVIWAEYAMDTARACHRRGIKTVAVTAGYITPAARASFFEDIDAANVDLKAIDEDFYHQLTYAHLQPVLDTLSWLKHDTDVWFEITNLVIPRANDSADDLRNLCDWILQHVGDEVPVHFTAFHPDFRMRDRPPTPLATLLEAYDIAKAQGIRFVYVGNVHDPAHDSTLCPNCSKLLIERNWHELGAYNLRDNRCPDCDTRIAGRFQSQPGSWGRRRLPIRISDYARSAPADGAATTTSGDLTMTHSDDGLERVNRSEEVSLPLTEHQELLVLRAACAMVVAGIRNRAVELRDPTLDGAAEKTVMGAFVTLKRAGHLRACCGTLGQPMPLIEALGNAAQRTATDDRRLPPISTTELPYLHVDVSLLHNFQTVTAQGTERVHAVQVGRHGLTIQRGQSGGLLLPMVPVEHGWDTESFLRQVCRKAELPSGAWADPATRLRTFEAAVIEGEIDQDLLVGIEDQTPRRFTDEELRLMADHCRTNVMALIEGATPNYYLPGCSDANVQGIALALTLPSQTGMPQFTRLSMRPGLPLQSTLFQLAESAAQWIKNARFPIAVLHELRTAVAVLHDSAMHGTVSAPDLRGFDPARRALLVIEQGRYAWSLAPEESATELLAATAQRARVLQPELAGVFSLAADSSTTTFSGASIPPPQQGPPVRPPAVAGVFYPEASDALDEMVTQLVRATATETTEAWRGVMVPHAGLKYSGSIAAAVFKQVAIPDRVIILAPKHTRLGSPWAVAPHASWSIPGHEVASDQELARRLAEGIDDLELDAAAHKDEHAIEVELPLLAHLAPTTRVVGITIGGGDLEHCRGFARDFAKVLQGETTPPLLVVSTDLNHYATESENRRLDQIALDALHQLDPALLFQTVREHDISMCGVLPAVIVMETLKNLGALKTCRQVAYATSADAGASQDRVVGYAGVLFR